MRIISIGEVLWDVIEGIEHLGGAPLNFAAHARRLGHDVRFVSGVGNDDRGDQVFARLEELGLSSKYVRRIEGIATGVVTVGFHDGQPQFEIHRPAAYDYPNLTDADLEELSAWQPEWIYFGTLAQTSEIVGMTLRKLQELAPKACAFYDVNLRAGCYTLALLRDLLDRADVVKLNDTEMREVENVAGLEHRSVEEFCDELEAKLGLRTVCVTRGAEGSSLLVGDTYVKHPAYAVKVADTVGAGDAFSAALVHGLGEGWEPIRIAEFCNRVGALVASRKGAIPEWSLEELRSLEPVSAHGQL